MLCISSPPVHDNHAAFCQNTLRYMRYMNLYTGSGPSSSNPKNTKQGFARVGDLFFLCMRTSKSKIHYFLCAAVLQW